MKSKPMLLNHVSAETGIPHSDPHYCFCFILQCASTASSVERMLCAFSVIIDSEPNQLVRLKFNCKRLYVPRIEFYALF